MKIIKSFALWPLQPLIKQTIAAGFFVGFLVSIILARLGYSDSNHSLGVLLLGIASLLFAASGSMLFALRKNKDFSWVEMVYIVILVFFCVYPLLCNFSYLWWDILPYFSSCDSPGLIILSVVIDLSIIFIISIFLKSFGHISAVKNAAKLMLLFINIAFLFCTAILSYLILTWIF